MEQYSGNIDEFLNEGMKYLNRAKASLLEKIQSEFIYVMKSMYCIMGRNTFRKICSDGRRRPINKAIFESWCYVVKNLSESDVERLIANRKQVQDKYIDLCEDNSYLYSLKAPDRKNMYFRMEAIKELVDAVIEDGA